MIRLIKRYESRKLYDTEESRYVSLEEIASWIRAGQEVRVLDNATSGDVTSQTLTQIILDEGRRGTSALPSELLHELVRLGERAVHSGVEQVQHGVDRLVQASIDRLGPVRRAREEMSSLRTRLEQLESSLAALDSEVLVGMAVPESPETAAPAPAAPAATLEARAAAGHGGKEIER
jgi:polyhydroxyalkanoate synthesis repressor PhaR